MSKPKGSGWFAATFGVLFVVAFFASFIPDLRFDQIPPLGIVRTWFAFVAMILVGWGVNRIRQTDNDSKTVGQDTINFVVGIIAATFALLELVNHR